MCGGLQCVFGGLLLVLLSKMPVSQEVCFEAAVCMAFWSVS